MHWGPCLQHGHSAPFEGHRGRPARAPPGCDATRRTSRRRPPRCPPATAPAPRHGLLLGGAPYGVPAHRSRASHPWPLARAARPFDRCPSPWPARRALEGRLAGGFGASSGSARTGSEVRRRRRQGRCAGGCRPALDDRASRRWRLRPGRNNSRAPLQRRTPCSGRSSERQQPSCATRNKHSIQQGQQMCLCSCWEAVPGAGLLGMCEG